jgi:cytochrome c biogenesis protein
MNTDGIHIKSRRAWLADSVELLSSMRFAISLLTIISIAAIIGTVLKQNEPMTNYVSQFGPFWYALFAKLSLYTVYSAWWFLLIMGLLVISTSLCIIRNAPKMLADVKSWRDNVREQSLRHFHHKVEWDQAGSLSSVAEQLAQQVAHAGFKVKVIEKDQALLIAAKRGAGNKWGYIFAHAAIVIICVGGLLDSDLPIRMQQWLFHKTPFTGSGLIANISPEHRLGVGNPSFRGNTMIPEGGASSTTIIPQQDGVLIQDLPITLYLEQFIIDYYSTGMPKRFASHVMVRDNRTGAEEKAVIEVNKPLIFNNIAIYQSSFEDGGSRLNATVYPMQGRDTATFALAGEVNGTTPLTGLGQDFDIEWSGFRAFNVENMVNAGTDVRAVNLNTPAPSALGASLDKHLGSGAKNISGQDLRNVGPSVQYKLRDKAGQAREFLNYMRPVEMDGAWVYLAGMRESPNEAFRYLRIPADDNDEITTWMQLRAALADPAMRAKAAQLYAQRALPAGASPALQQQLAQSAQRGLDLFAGDEKMGGFVAVSQFLENIPKDEQVKAADIFMKIFNGSMWALWEVSRDPTGKTPLNMDDAHAQFLQLAITALSDARFYPSPVYLQLTGFEEVKASVFQVTRSPGKNIVYAGCLFLVLGIFAMLYIRERRLWIWLRASSPAQTHALMAMSTQRKTLDFEHEFNAIKTQLSPDAPAAPDNVQ